MYIKASGVGAANESESVSLSRSFQDLKRKRNDFNARGKSEDAKVLAGCL